jgi:hypothetical protein
MVNAMDYENMLKDSFAYTKEGIFDKINRWVLLIIGTIILTIPLLGYVAKIFRAEKPAPEVQNWGSLFVDGIKLLIVEIVYFIPVMILWAIMMFVLGSSVSPAANPYGAYGMTPMTGMAGAGAFGILIFLVEIVIAILLPVALIRFARSGNFNDAFDFHAIFDKIGKIGWVSYIIALIIGGLVVGIPLFIIMFIISAIIMAVMGLSALMVLPVIMVIIYLILAPLIAVFMGRYMTLVFDSVTA